MFCPYHPDKKCDRIISTTDAITCTECGDTLPSFTFSDGVARMVEYTCSCGQVNKAQSAMPDFAVRE